MVTEIKNICKDHYLFNKKWFRILVRQYENREIKEGAFKRKVVKRIRAERERLTSFEVKINEI